MFILSNGNRIKNLIANDIERYRLVNNKSTLLYAKGKILFNLNLIKKGYSSNPHGNIDYKKNKNYQEELYAFYDDGFYTYDKEKNKWKKQDDLLKNINNFSSKSAKFLGWYTTPKDTNNVKGKEITNIADLKSKTKIFEYSKDTSIPTVTLYARWEIKLCTVVFKSISRKYQDHNMYTGKTTTRSTKAHIPYVFNGQKLSTTSSHVCNKVPYGATLAEVEEAPYPYGLGWGKNSKITPYYDTNLVTNDNDYGGIGGNSGWLWTNREAFYRGWYISDDGKGKTIDKEKFIIINTGENNTPKETIVFPQFDAIVFWRSEEFECEPGWGWTGSWIREMEPPVKMSQAKEAGKIVPCFHVKNENWPTYKWEYSKSNFPLGSGDVLIIRPKKV